MSRISCSRQSDCCGAYLIMLMSWKISKGDLGPFHHHCLGHSQSYITAMGEWFVHGPAVEGHAEKQQVGSVPGQGVGVTGGLLPNPMPGQPHLTPHQRPRILQRWPYLGTYRKEREKTANLFSFFWFCNFLHFLCLCVRL